MGIYSDPATYHDLSEDPFWLTYRHTWARVEEDSRRWIADVLAAWRRK